MIDRYFVQVETFAPYNNKCRAFIKWVETFNNALIVPGITVDGGVFTALTQIVMNHCKALDKESPGTAPFIINTAGRVIFIELKSKQAVDYNVARLIVKKVERLFEVHNNIQLDVAFYQYIETGGEE
jgi:hypothetical protein